ncbi:hypothetical protein L202_04152 [Cryptococcus amylolentus CBS 6039]|uniref:Sulfhydryl oxidase n=1 Tax=Cryptococcus amylolentus CBS 6039 TaxID=1295533 RepID=A0A1E3HQA3_9TREE|nr:hypothetical protein L202_04152 [Cryptococcus amylolentus CBS 6039]ODN78528.1 hypothetical protein L202_04152 [Cryptococcus amylolentus CBS 6039]
MLGPIGHLPRLVRLTLLATALVVLPTLYFLYPSPERLPSPGEWQAGGIDSDHWRSPVKPAFGEYELEEGRGWDDQSGVGGSRGWGQGKKKAPEIGQDVIHGGVIMPKLGNATAKAELGRSAWRVLHLMTLRYPEEPTEDDRLALKSYFHLFSRLYPCGECAQEFQKLLKEFPPQTSSRKSASLWLCHVHNQVNARLGKLEFDCLTLDATYDCGCGDEGNSTSTSGLVPDSDRNVVKAMTAAVNDPEILDDGGQALQGEFELAASAEGVGLSADQVDESNVLDKESEELNRQDQVGELEWRKSQNLKQIEWDQEKAEHGVD